MSEIRETVRDIRENSPTPAEALQAVSRAKAVEVLRRWDSFQGKNLDGVATFRTRTGKATIGGIRHRQDAEKLDSVEVWTGPVKGSPAYRLINPPMLVEDPQGDVILTENDPLRKKKVVRKYRVDPLQAIAEFLGSQNGRSERG